MDFKSMTVKDFFEVNGGEIFDLVTSKGLIPADKAAAIEAAIKAK